MIHRSIIQAYAKRMAREQDRKVTLAEAEAEVGEVIQRVAMGIAVRFTFGYHTRQDIEQEAIVIALEVLSLNPPKYDTTRPLENFLHIHLRNQLSNFKRKHYARPEAPCLCCSTSLADPPASPCRKWLDWRRRNIAKQNIMRPINMANVADDSGESTMYARPTAEQDAASQEMLDKIDEYLPVDLRADYLRMREHASIPKVRRQRVREAVLAILGRPAVSQDVEEDD